MNDWIGRLAPRAVALLAVVTSGQAATLDELGRDSFWLSNVGEAGLVVKDVDHDGRDDLVFASAGGDPVLAVYGWSGDGSFGQHELLSLGHGAPIVSVLGWTHGASRHVIAIDATGLARDFAGSPLVKMRSFATAPGVSAQIGDIDADGADDLVVLSIDALHIYSMTDGHPERSYQLPSSAPVGDIALAQLDADAALEIVVATSNAGAGWVVDGATGALDWTSAHGFGQHVAVGRIGANAERCWAGDKPPGFSVFCSDPYAALWSTTTAEDVGALVAADIDGNGRDALLVGDGQWGALHVFDTETRAERYAIPHDAAGIRGAVAGNLGGDGGKAIAFAGAGGIDGYTGLTLADAATGETEYRYVPANGPMTVAAIGDVDGDGIDEVVAVAQQYTFPATVMLLDFDTGAVKWRSAPNPASFDDPFYVAPFAVRIVPHRDRSGADLVLAGNQDSDGRLEVIDGTDISEVFHVSGWDSILGSRGLTDVALFDYDGDGIDDYVVIANVTRSDITGVQLLVLSGVDGSALWISPAIGSTTVAARVFVVGSSEGHDLVAVTRNGLWAFDAATGAETWSLAAINEGAVLVPYGVAGPEMAVFSGDGAVVFYDAATRAKLREFALDGPVCDIALPDGDVQAMLVARDAELLLFDGGSGFVRATAGEIGSCSLSRTRIAARSAAGSGYSIAIGTPAALFRERVTAVDRIFAGTFDTL